MTETNETGVDKDFIDLQQRMKIISAADPSQYQNEFALKRYLTAFGNADAAFYAILKTNAWREKYGVKELAQSNIAELYANKARVLRHRDRFGRPVIYIPARNHNDFGREIDEITKYLVFCLEKACGQCFEEVTDKLCIIFDLAGFSSSSIDYQLLKNLIWLLGKHYPERLGVCLIINATTLFWTTWLVIKQWLNEKSAQKVVFVDNEMKLCEYLIPDILPKDM